MILTVHVAISWPDNRSGPPSVGRGKDALSIRDPRVLLGVQQVLAKRVGVTQAPDLVGFSGAPYFAVSLDDRSESTTISLDALLDWLTEPIAFSIAYDENGVKTSPVNLDVDVIS